MILETRHSIPEILSRQPPFRVLNGAELGILATGTQEFRVAKHEVLFQKGDCTRGMYLVITGQVKLYLPSQGGSEKIVHMASAGESFGEEGAFIDRHCPVSAQATRDSILLHLDHGVLLRAVERSPILARALLTRLANRMCQLIENMETCVQRNSAQRVVHFLTQNMPTGVDSFAVELEANKQTIASQLNLAPETFSRVLSRLSRDGYIRVNGRNITVVTVRELRDYAG